MKFALSIIPIAAALLVSAAPFKRDVNPALVPEFGHPSGLNPTGTGDCDGITNAAGQVVKIPCACPPERNEFLQSLNANVNAGFAVNNPSIKVSFPTDGSKDSQLARMQAVLVTLQNTKGPGVGCPAASTTFLAQQKAIQDGNAPPAPAPAPAPEPAPAPAPAPVPAAGGIDPALIPEIGHPSGLNPTGTGDCDGITNAAGQVVKIPCSCPPDRETFIKALNANVAAGKAVNNPSVAVSFPTDGSNASKASRINASLITLQNLNGPGVGCPAASSTLLAQLKDVQG
ncbi:hypothetical protein D9615_003057 [Tricholomella constricta]|uniref:Uncharacterized protein n=1 Tax=Tricholomella constricta TaxID=117010 RepID=A0A8H5HFN8_9AGAR|nr:hypothetical protein D9615_003057 [Tricholomella constricta]